MGRIYPGEYCIDSNGPDSNFITLQGVILSSFYVGYMITQIPGGLLAQKYGGKYTMGLAVLSTAVLSLLTPITVDKYGSTGLIVLRFLMGILEGPAVPAASVLISKWAPAHERTKIGTTVMSGMTAGTVVGNALSGVLIQHSPIGWPMVFYFFGSLSILWFFAWIFLCYNYPDVHPFISDMEKKYLRETTEENTSRQKRSIPWRHIATSVPFWALLAGKAGFVWGSNTLTADLPKYMTNVLRFSIQANGLLSALPYAIKVVISMMASWLSDWLIKKNKMSRTNVRKTLATTASAMSAIFLLAASYAGCERTLVVVYFTIAVSMMAFFVPGIMVNINDLSPNYAGTLMSVANMVASITGILAPYVAGIITTNQALSEWRMVFWINFAIAVFSSLVYLLWADGEVQYWDDMTTSNEKQQEIKLQEGVSFLRDSPKPDTP